MGDLELKTIDWVIVGGESGSRARAMQKEWVKNIYKQCKDQSIPFFFKQWGTYSEQGIKKNKKSKWEIILKPRMERNA